MEKGVCAELIIQILNKNVKNIKKYGIIPSKALAWLIVKLEIASFPPTSSKNNIKIHKKDQVVIRPRRNFFMLEQGKCKIGIYLFIFYFEETIKS